MCGKGIALQKRKTAKLIEIVENTSDVEIIGANGQKPNQISNAYIDCICMETR